MKINNLSQKRTAIIWGSTGLIGSCLKKMLLDNNEYSSILCPVRKPSGDNHFKLKEIVLDFDSLIDKPNPAILENLQADHVFVTLGTTIKKAGSQGSFRKVDCVTTQA
jgi:thioester reductase-like protein